jgi:hypothetical protein
MRTSLLTVIAAGLILAGCDSATDPAPPAQQVLSSPATASLEFLDLQYPASITQGAVDVTAFSISPLGLRLAGTTVKSDPVLGVVSHWFTLRLSSPFGNIVASAEGTGRAATGRAINDQGDLAGWQPNAEGVTRPFIRLAGGQGTTELKLAGSDRKATARAFGINDQRTVVGGYLPAGKVLNIGFLVSVGEKEGSVIPISSGLKNPPIVGDLGVVGINDRGDFVGGIRDAAGIVHGFVVLHSSDSDQWIDLGAAQPGFWPDPNGVFLAGINNSRMIVGWSGNSGFFGWVNDDGTVRNLTQVDRVPVPPGQPAPLRTQLNGVSDAGVMVGSYNGNSFLARVR